MDNVTVGRVVFSSGAGRPERKDVTAQIEREKAAHVCECGKDKRIADLERDGAKLQGLNQRLAARVAELEKSQEAGKCPTRKALEAVLAGFVCRCRCRPTAPGMKCGHRKQLEMIQAALSAPCPCDSLRARVETLETALTVLDREVRNCSGRSDAVDRALENAYAALKEGK